MHCGNEASALEPCPGRIACACPLRASPVARAAPSSTPLRCWSISLGRSACIPYPSFFHTRTPQRACSSLFPTSNCCPSYTRSLTIIYCLDLFPLADPLQDTRTRTLSHLDETRCLPIRTLCPLFQTHSSPLGRANLSPLLLLLPCASAATWRARLPFSTAKPLCACTTAPSTSIGLSHQLCLGMCPRLLS